MVEWKKLADLCEVKGRIGFRGYTREDQVEKGDGALSLSPGNIVDDVLDYNSCTYITWDKYEESPEIMVSEGDIILCKTASVGKVARIHELPQKATINPQLVLLKNIKINPQYLFYVLADAPFQSRIKRLAGVGSVPNVSQAKLSSIELPIPSLSEQQRIVGILDTFTASIDNLKAQIAQRRKQYEYYRDQLLDLEGKEGVEMKTLGEVLISLKTGLNPRKNFVLNSPESKNFYITVRELGMFNVKPIDKTDKVSDDALKLINNRSNLEEGDVLFSGTGTIGRTALVMDKPKNWNIKEGVYSLKPRKECINSSFLVQLLHTNSIIDKISALVVGDPIRSIPMKSLVSVIIPVPSLSDQHRIVSILDTFEASISNLEAQLKQREQQYEYYRNKLLTFE